MDTLIACRICLITDVKMFSLRIPHLNNAYFKFTGVMNASSPTYVCYECANILLKSEQFRLKCAQANRILTCIVLENSKITKDLIKTVDRNKYGLVSNIKYYLNEQYSIDCNDFEDTKHDIDIKHDVENIDVDVKIDGVYVDDTNMNLENNYIHVKIDSLDVDNTDVENDVIYEENDTKTDKINETNELDLNLLDSPKANKKNHKRKRMNENMKDVMSEEKLDQEKAILEIDRKNIRNYNKSASKKLRKRKSTNENMKDVMSVEKLDQDKAMLEIIYRKNSENYKKSHYKCELCFRGFVTIKTYNNHMKKHNSNGRTFECDFCHVMINTKYRVYKHIQTNHTHKYKCKICTYLCFNQTQARYHVLRHRGKKYPCELCGEVYDYSNTLLAHKKIKHQTPCACELCGETFSNERGVFLHKGRIHIQEINEKLGPECKTCRVHFASEKAWKRHLIHSSNHQDISGCKVCGVIVDNFEQLEEHLRVSQNCKPIRKTSRKRTFKLPKEIHCKVCNQRFNRYESCHSHMRKEHPETQYICQICGKVLSTKGMLYNHIRVHDGKKPYKCTKCDKSYTVYGSYYQHTQTHKGLKYECDICRKTYNLKPLLRNHMKRHVGIKPFKCAFCDKAFTERCEAKYHAEYIHLNKPWPKRDRRKIKKCEN